MASDLPLDGIMTPDVVVLHVDDSLEDAFAALASRGISGAPVVDSGGRLVGLLDDSDLLLSEARIHAPSAIEILGAYIPIPGTFRRFEDEVRHALGRTVGDLMEADPPRLPRSATVEDVATLMVERSVSRVPVVDGDGRVVGIVSRGDLVAALGRRP